jgi:hypothetical protein
LTQQGTATGAAIGGSFVALGSAALDVATGGINILATPAEIAMGMAVGGAVGNAVSDNIAKIMSDVHYEQCPNKDNTCTLRGIAPSKYPGFSQVTYDCKTFPSWPIIRYIIPSVVKTQALTQAPCAPGFPYDLMPMGISDALNKQLWKICRYRN